MTFELTPKQQAAQQVLTGNATHILGEGGSRSGKTFLFVRAVVARALVAPNSRHAIMRFRLNHLKASIIAQTFPQVMRLCFPTVRSEINKTDLYEQLPNGSQIWFGGLDDKDRVDKVLGQEYATVYLNEVSQIPLSSRDTALTRLAQKVERRIEGQAPSLLPLRAYYDQNPTTKAHWSYRLFHEKRDPSTRVPLANPDDYAVFRINPEDNAANLAPTYLDNLRGLSARMRRRFLEGAYAEANPNALFSEADIDAWRVIDGRVPDMVRVVVAVDPSGADDDEENADQDAIGILVVGLGTDGNAYVLEDVTVKAGPATWGRVATSAFDRHAADVIVGERNFGGEMVRHTIQTARPRTNYKHVTASRGKVVRAEPCSALYEQGKVRHVGQFPELEEELSAFSTHGYTGPGSPNRADALVWALTELFPGLTKAPEEPAPKDDDDDGHWGERGWMAG